MPTNSLNQPCKSSFNIALPFEVGLPFTYVGDGKIYKPVSPFPDGNCGLYAFACGLIDCVINNTVTLKEDIFIYFIKCIRLRNKYGLKQQPPLDVLVQKEISNFLKLIALRRLTFSKFKKYIKKSLTKESIIALNLVFCDALRHIGIEHYIKKIELFDIPLMEEDERLRENGAWVGTDLLVMLADSFGIDIKFIFSPNQCVTNLCSFSSQENPSIKTCISFALLLYENHWYYLIPEEKKTGLIKILPHGNTNQDAVDAPSVHINNQTPLKIKNNVLKNIIAIFVWVIEWVAKTISIVINFLRKIFCCEKNRMPKESTKNCSTYAEATVSNQKANLDLFAEEQLPIAYTSDQQSELASPFENVKSSSSLPLLRGL